MSYRLLTREEAQVLWECGYLGFEIGFGAANSDTWDTYGDRETPPKIYRHARYRMEVSDGA